MPPEGLETFRTSGGIAAIKQKAQGQYIRRSGNTSGGAAIHMASPQYLERRRHDTSGGVAAKEWELELMELEIDLKE